MPVHFVSILRGYCTPNLIFGAARNLVPPQRWPECVCVCGGGQGVLLNLSSHRFSSDIILERHTTPKVFKKLSESLSFSICSSLSILPLAHSPFWISSIPKPLGWNNESLPLLAVDWALFTKTNGLYIWMLYTTPFPLLTMVASLVFTPQSHSETSPSATTSSITTSFACPSVTLNYCHCSQSLEAGRKKKR